MCFTFKTGDLFIDNSDGTCLEINSIISKENES